MFKYHSGEPYYVIQDSEIPEPISDRPELVEESDRFSSGFFDPEAWWMIPEDQRYLLDDDTLGLIEQLEKESR